jgi:hypothetical protein
MVQVENHVIALCYGEGEIRIWDLEAEDSAMFRLNKEKGYDPAERVVSVTYSTKKGIS